MPYEKSLGSKTIYGFEQDDGRIKAMAECEVYGPIASVIVLLTKAQAEKLFADNRTELIQDILPDVPREVREVFISGTTPAEYDFISGRPVKSLKAYGCYEWDPEDISDEMAAMTPTEFQTAQRKAHYQEDKS
jgi:hypothetical protein